MNYRRVYQFARARSKWYMRVWRRQWNKYSTFGGKNVSSQSARETYYIRRPPRHDTVDQGGRIDKKEKRFFIARLLRKTEEVHFEESGKKISFVYLMAHRHRPVASHLSIETLNLRQIFSSLYFRLCYFYINIIAVWDFFHMCDDEMNWRKKSLFFDSCKTWAVV